MPRDMKLGLALGVAVVGIVAALFFRRDPAERDAAPPPLPVADELDREISERPKSPYISGLSEFVEAPADTPATPAVGTTASHSKARPDAYDLPDFLSKEDSEQHREFLQGKPKAVPDPISAGSSAGNAAAHRLQTPAPSPAHNRDWQPEGPVAGRTGPPARGESRSDSSGGRRTHVVREGETLSSLAAKYLGSSARFHEIYEANRDVLRSPNDLRDGVTLVIPEARKAGAAPGAEGSRPAIAGPKAENEKAVPEPGRHSESLLSGDAQPGKLRFAPVPRGSLTAGRTGGATTNAADDRRAPPQDDRPARPRIEIDDRDPFD